MRPLLAAAAAVMIAACVGPGHSDVPPPITTAVSTSKAPASFPTASATRDRTAIARLLRECDAEPLPSELVFTRHRRQIGAETIALDVPSTWEVRVGGTVEGEATLLILGNLQSCDDLGITDYVSEGTRVFVRAKQDESYDYSKSWEQELMQGYFPGRPATLLARYESPILRTTGITLMLKYPEVAGYPTTTTFTRYTAFHTLFYYNKRTYDIQMDTPDEIIENSRIIYQRILESLLIS